MALSPLNKGILLFSSLPSSLPYLSYISPVGSKCLSMSQYDAALVWRERWRRDMGEMEMISTVLRPHCTKAIPAMMGEMRDYFECVLPSIANTICVMYLSLDTIKVIHFYPHLFTSQVSNPYLQGIWRTWGRTKVPHVPSALCTSAFERGHVSMWGTFSNSLIFASESLIVAIATFNTFVQSD